MKDHLLLRVQHSPGISFEAEGESSSVRWAYNLWKRKLRKLGIIPWTCGCFGANRCKKHLHWWQKGYH